jgi:cyclase
MAGSAPAGIPAALVLVLALATAMDPAALPAQTRPVVARDSGARMERLAEGVYAIIHEDATTDWETGVTEWPHGNTGVIVGEDGVLVVDATYLPARARADIGLIRAVTALPVRFLVNTHWHGDHTHGNAVYRETFPGLQIVGSIAGRDWISVNQARYPAVVASGGSSKQASIERLRGLLERGADSSGQVLSETRKAALAENIRRRQIELEEFRRIVVSPPTVLFDDVMVIYLGSRRVELQNRGPANSPADITIYLPAEQVLFAGDIVVYPVPYVGASHPLPWIEVLKGLERTPILHLVPGHGPVLADLGYVRLVRELFEATRDRVRAQMLQGSVLDQIVKQTDLADFRARFLEIREPGMAARWDGTPEVLIERMHQCVQGYRC